MTLNWSLPRQCALLTPVMKRTGRPITGLKYEDQAGKPFREAWELHAVAKEHERLAIQPLTIEFERVPGLFNLIAERLYAGVFPLGHAISRGVIPRLRSDNRGRAGGAPGLGASTSDFERQRFAALYGRPTSQLLVWRQQDIKRIDDIRARLLASLPLADRARNLSDLGRDPSLSRVLVADRQMKSIAHDQSVANTTDSPPLSARRRAHWRTEWRTDCAHGLRTAFQSGF